MRVRVYALTTAINFVKNVVSALRRRNTSPHQWLENDHTNMLMYVFSALEVKLQSSKPQNEATTIVARPLSFISPYLFLTLDHHEHTQRSARSALRRKPLRFLYVTNSLSQLNV